MFKQPAGDPAEDFIIYEAAKLEGTSAHEINWNQLKWGWGREGTAHTITCSSNCYYSSLMETLHWKLHTESQWHAGVKTHTGWSVYLKHLDDSWLSRYCLISSTVLYYNHYVHQERQPRVRAHTHTLYFHISYHNSRGFQVPAEAQQILLPRVSFQKRGQRRIIFSLVHVMFARSCFCTQVLSVSSACCMWLAPNSQVSCISSKGRSTLTSSLLLQRAILTIQAVSILAQALMTLLGLHSDIKEFIHRAVSL